MTTETHREQLSALLDGELEPDRARFLLRRLSHDHALSDALGRWQLAGDALRGESNAPAPAGFAEAIAARIAAEAGGDASSVTPRVSESASGPLAAAPRPARWRWFGGGALAASLAFAAMLVLRQPVVEAEMPAVPVAGTVVPVETPAAAPVRAETPVTSPVAAEAVAIAATDAPVDASRRASAPAIEREAAPAAAQRAVRTRPAMASASAEDVVRVASEAAIEPAPTPARDPFSQPAAKSGWPRAVLPATGATTFNARLDGGASTFYPFEPRPVPATDGPAD